MPDESITISTQISAYSFAELTPDPATETMISPHKIITWGLADFLVTSN